MSFKHWLSPSVPPLFYYNVYRLSFFEKFEYRSVGYHYTNQKICVHRLVLTPTVTFHQVSSFELCWNSAYKKKSNYLTHIHMHRFHDIIFPIYGGISRILNRKTHVFHLNQIIQNGFQTDQFINPFQYKIPSHSSFIIFTFYWILQELHVFDQFIKDFQYKTAGHSSFIIFSWDRISFKLLWSGILYWNGSINWSIWNPFCIIWFKWKTCVSLLIILDIPP